MKGWLAGIALLSATNLGAQSLGGVIVARENGERLGYAIVSLIGRQMDGFASDSGTFRFVGLSAGPVTLRVRRLGYQPLDTTIYLRRDEAADVRIALTRIAVRLRGITVDAPPPCLNPGLKQIEADSALATVVSQLKLNAEQYKFLVEHYPLEYTVEIIRSSRLRADSQPRIDGHYKQVLDARPSWNYKPGTVIVGRGPVMMFRIPTLVDFADRDFLANHCFHLRGQETVDSVPLLRIDVVAAEKIQDPDVHGRIYLDPATFQIRRTVLRLSRITRPIRHLAEFEVRTDFREILTSIPVIFDVYGVQTVAPDEKALIDVAYEEQRLMSHRWLKRKPGEEGKKSP